jgi:hypothetical protein
MTTTIARPSASPTFCRPAITLPDRAVAIAVGTSGMDPLVNASAVA